MKSLIEYITMKSRLLFIILSITTTTSIFATSPTYAVVIESGTQKIFNNIASKAKQQQIANQDIGSIVVWSSMQLLNSPYVGRLLDKSVPEYLYISLSNTDCMLFIEQVVVLSRLIKSGQLTFAHYIDGIKQIRYHGQVSYCNRNHYFKDWILVNQKKGYIKDIALGLSGKQLPYSAEILSRLIANSESNVHYADLSCMKERESLINQQALGFIASADIPKYQHAIKSGDIIGVVTDKLEHADSIQHLGIAYVKNGKISYINASSKKANMKVVVYDDLLAYIRQHNFVGIVVVRVLP